MKRRTAVRRGVHGRTMPLAQLLPVEKFDDAWIAAVGRHENCQRGRGRERASVLRGLLPYLERRLIGLLLVEVTTGYGFYERLEVSRRDVAVKIVEIMRLGYSLGSCQLCVGQFASLVCLGKMPQIYE